MELVLNWIIFQLTVGKQKVRKRLQLQDHVLNRVCEPLDLLLHGLLPFQVVFQLLLHILHHSRGNNIIGNSLCDTVPDEMRADELVLNYLSDLDIFLNYCARCIAVYVRKA